MRSLYTEDEVTAVIRRWLILGLSRSAVENAAGVRTDQIRRGGPVTAATFAAVSRVTEDDFHPRNYVYADLTRTRIFSLMAIGHQLKDMPVNPRGKWRDRPLTTVSTARAVRAYFHDKELEVGDAIHTMVRARSHGHIPPLGWDDPGTLAWPDGLSDYTTDQPRGVSWSEVDHVTVERVLAGEKLPTTHAEKLQIMARWLAAGRSESSLCDRLGWKTGRYVPDMEATG